MPLSTTPERLATMLVDAHESILAAYHFTQESIDQANRPCWLVFIEDASLQNTTVDQELMEQGYSLAYIGQTFSGALLGQEGSEYEMLAREVADATLIYFLEHPQLQMTNKRGVFDEILRGLDGVQQMTVNSRSAVTLYTRDGVEGEAFWGFTMDITVREQIAYETVGY